MEKAMFLDVLILSKIEILHTRNLQDELLLSCYYINVHESNSHL